MSKMYNAMKNPLLNIIDLQIIIPHLSPKLVSRRQDENVYWNVLFSAHSTPKIAVGWSPEWLSLSFSYLSNGKVELKGEKNWFVIMGNIKINYFCHSEVFLRLHIWLQKNKVVSIFLRHNEVRCSLDQLACQNSLAKGRLWPANCDIINDLTGLSMNWYLKLELLWGWRN